MTIDKIVHAVIDHKNGAMTREERRFTRCKSKLCTALLLVK
jgi:hypothetical protein